MRVVIRKKCLTVIVLALILGFSFMSTGWAGPVSPGFYAWETKTTDDENKTWTVYFSIPLDVDSINDNVYITDSENKEVDTQINTSADNRSVTIKPMEAYKRNIEYRIYINDGLRDKNGNNLAQKIVMPFIVTDGFIRIIGNNYSSFVTNINVSTSSDVFILKANNVPMHYHGGDKFRLGKAGLTPGSTVYLKAYDYSGKLLESTSYVVSGN